MKARIGSWPFHEHSRWQTRKMSIAQRPDLISPSSEPAKYANCAKNAECANCTNYDFTFFRFQLPSFLLVQRPPSTRHLCLTSRRAPTSCKSRKSSRQGSDWSTYVGSWFDWWLYWCSLFILMFVLICVVRFLNPITPTSIVTLTTFQSSLMYTWATKKTGVSKWKKKEFFTQAQVRACLSVDAADPAFKHARSDLVSLAGFVQ